MENKNVSVKMEIFGILFRFSRSILFNISCIVIGFIIGYQFFQQKQYINYIHDQDVKCIERIHSILKEHIKLNEQMNDEFSKLKASIQH